jgi:hypothetical protein
MASSLQALLAGILDYAGLFPPAKLPLHQAIHQYERYRHDPDSWMLGRFLCPAERLGELATFVPSLFSSDFPLAISVLGRGGKSAPEFLTALRADVDAIADVQNRHGALLEITSYEVRVPGDILAGKAPDAAGKLLNDAAKIIEDPRIPRLTPYYEAASGAAWRSSAILLSTVLADDNRRVGQGHGRCGPAGFKVRCGGLEAADFPSPEQVAFAITACRDASVPLKFTAGLHHPVRHFNAGVQTRMHGFLNVFTAGVLAHARRLNEDQVRRILEDEAPADFAFDDDGLRWDSLHATVAEISAARRSSVISFGSCSFEEPRDDLQAMGLLN